MVVYDLTKLNNWKQNLLKNRMKCKQLGVSSKSYRIRKKRLKPCLDDFRLRSFPWNAFVKQGPWNSEFDFYSWISPNTGYRCIIRRHYAHGQLNGYVLLPKDHPLYKRNLYEEIKSLEWFKSKRLHEPLEDEKNTSPNLNNLMDILLKGEIRTSPAGILKVHGGANYADWLRYRKTRVWAIGFDTGHSEDLSPGMHMSDHPFNSSFTTLELFNPTYKNKKYVAEQCEYLASQLKQIERISNNSPRK